MKQIAILSVLACVVVGLSSAPALAQQSQGGAGTHSHSLTSATLHKTVKSSHARVAGAREYVGAILATPEVTKQVTDAGVSPDSLRVKLAALSDAEIVALQQQLMAAENQENPAGALSQQAIILIVAAGVLTIVLFWVVVFSLASNGY